MYIYIWGKAELNGQKRTDRTKPAFVVLPDLGFVPRWDWCTALHHLLSVLCDRWSWRCRAHGRGGQNFLSYSLLLFSFAFDKRFCNLIQIFQL